MCLTDESFFTNLQQSKMKTAHPSIVEPLLNMLGSLRLEVQDEGKVSASVVQLPVLTS